MNKTLLLFIIDFLFLNLIALTRWVNVEPAKPVQQPMPSSVTANAASADKDLAETMRESLADEQAVRAELEKKLAGLNGDLAARGASLAQTQAVEQKTEADLADSRRGEADLGQQLSSAKEESALMRDQLAQLQRELGDKTAEAARQRDQIAGLQKETTTSQKQIEGLTMAVVVDEADKQHLKEEAAQLQTQVQAERSERLQAQASTAKLADNVGQLADDSGKLTQEIRENQPINANVLYNDFTANQVVADFTAVRKGLFGSVDKSEPTPTVFTTDGKQVYALLHMEDTPFSVWGTNYDWSRIGVAFDRGPDGGGSQVKFTPGPGRTMADSIEFLEADPRIVVVPVDASQAAALGVKVYPLAKDPFKFPDAILISGKKGYGELGFKLDPSHPGYVRVDNRFFKRLFGDFAPSRGDLVFSHTGELLGIMVNSTYCAILRDFTPLDTIRTGDDTASQHTGALLDALGQRIQAMPPELQ